MAKENFETYYRNLTEEEMRKEIKREELQIEDIQKESISNEYNPEQNYDEEPSYAEIDSMKVYLKDITWYGRMTPEEELKCAICMTGKGADVQKARDEMVTRNLGLVISIAKRYVNHRLELMDLVQAGNLGLIEAAKRFDYQKGAKFSTYAAYWILQKIEVLSKESNLIQVKDIEKITRAKNAQSYLATRLGREPSLEEMSEYLDITEEEVSKLLSYSMTIASLDKPVGKDDENSSIGDLVESKNTPNPEDEAEKQNLRDVILKILDELNDQEKKILKLRFGLDDGCDRTWSEVGKACNMKDTQAMKIGNMALRKMEKYSTLYYFY